MKVPCKVWDFDPTIGEKVWGDSLVAVYGPIQVPDIGGVAVDDTKAKLLMAGALKPEDLK